MRRVIFNEGIMSRKKREAFTDDGNVSEKKLFTILRWSSTLERLVAAFEQYITRSKFVQNLYS